MSKEVVAEVIALIELGMIAPEDIVKCLRKANSEPAQRTWIGLTDEEMQALWDRYAHMEMMRAIEAKLKEKNNG